MSTSPESLFNALAILTVIMSCLTVVVILRGMMLPIGKRGTNFIGLIALITSSFTLVFAFFIAAIILFHLPRLLADISDSLILEMAPLIISFIICAYAQTKSSIYIRKKSDYLKNDKESKTKTNQKMIFELNNTAQYFFYISTILVCGLSIARGDGDIYTVVGSWMLLFIVDDFIIINDYRRIYLKYAVHSHKLRFPFTNTILFACNLLILREEPDFWVTMIGAVQFISLLLSSEYLTKNIFGDRMVIN
jgi:hypothetical protein